MPLVPPLTTPGAWFSCLVGVQVVWGRGEVVVVPSESDQIVGGQRAIVGIQGDWLERWGATGVSGITSVCKEHRVVSN